MSEILILTYILDQTRIKCVATFFWVDQRHVSMETGHILEEADPQQSPAGETEERSRSS